MVALICFVYLCMSIMTALFIAIGIKKDWFVDCDNISKEHAISYGALLGAMWSVSLGMFFGMRCNKLLIQRRSRSESSYLEK